MRIKGIIWQYCEKDKKTIDRIMNSILRQYYMFENIQPSRIVQSYHGEMYYEFPNGDCWRILSIKVSRRGQRSNIAIVPRFKDGSLPQEVQVMSIPCNTMAPAAFRYYVTEGEKCNDS